MVVELYDKEQVVKFMMSMDADRDKVVKADEIVQGENRYKHAFELARITTILDLLGVRKDSSLTEEQLRERLESGVELKETNEKGEKGVTVDVTIFKDGLYHKFRSFATEADIKKCDLDNDGKTTQLEFMSVMMQTQSEEQAKYPPPKYDLWAELSKADSSKDGKLTLDEVTKYIDALPAADRGRLGTILPVLDLRGNEITKESLDKALQVPFQFNLVNKSGERGYAATLLRGDDKSKGFAIRQAVFPETYFQEFDDNMNGVSCAEAISALVEAQKIAQDNKGVLDPAKMPPNAKGYENSK
jgi:hypothetical protein